MSEKSTYTIGIGIQKNGVEIGNKEYFSADGTSFLGNMTFDAYHIEIPINYKRYWLDKLYTKAGLSGMYNFRNATTFRTDDFEELNNTDVIHDSQIRTLNAYLNFGVGYECFTTDHFSIYVEPHAQYAIFTRTFDVPINQRLVVFGLSTGIKF